MLFGSVLGKSSPTAHAHFFTVITISTGAQRFLSMNSLFSLRGLLERLIYWSLTTDKLSSTCSSAFSPMSPWSSFCNHRFSCVQSMINHCCTVVVFGVLCLVCLVGLDSLVDWSLSSSSSHLVPPKMCSALHILAPTHGSSDTFANSCNISVLGVRGTLVLVAFSSHLNAMKYLLAVLATTTLAITTHRDNNGGLVSGNPIRKVRGDLGGFFGEYLWLLEKIGLMIVGFWR